MPKMHFRRCYAIPNMCMHPNEPPQRFGNVGALGTIVEIRNYPSDARSRWLSGPQMLAYVSLELEVSRRAAALFDSRWKGEIPEGMSSEDFHPRRVQTEQLDPNVAMMPGRKAPDFLGQALKPVEAAIDEAINVIGGLLRWRCNLAGPIELPPLDEFEWSMDGVNWRLDPRRPAFPAAEWGPDLVIDAARRADLDAMLASNTREPLHQSLLREALSMRSSNPRSALAIGVTAAETAIKWLVGRVAPDAAWLVQNLPSPPIAKIVEEYLSTFPRTPPMKFSAEVIKALKFVVNARNDLVHGKGTSLDDAMMERGFAALRDVVWLCDYYGGIPWAVNRVRPTTLAELGLQPTVNNTGWFVD